MRDTFGEEVAEHGPQDCPNCGGSGFYKLPYGAPADGREVEDEDNCYCDCHDDRTPPVLEQREGALE